MKPIRNSLAILAALAGGPGSVFAASADWQNTGTSSWFVSTNWSTGLIPSSSTFVFVDGGTAYIPVGIAPVPSGIARADQFVVGWNGTGAVQIYSGATLAVAGSVVGASAGSHGTLEILGGSWTNSMLQDSIWIGHQGTGTVNLRDNGSMTLASGTGWVVLGNKATGQGTLNIGTPSGSAPAAPGAINGSHVTTGSGSGVLVLNHSSTNYYLTKTGASGGAAVGLTGGLQLRVENGITVLTGTADHTGGTIFKGGTLRVASGGALRNLDTGLTVANASGESGTLEIRTGGTVTSALATVGYGAGASGTVSISGTGAEWSTTNNGLPFVIGRSGQGTLTVTDGGRINVVNGAGSVNLGAIAGARGTLNIGNRADLAAAAPGVVNAAFIYKGSGTGTLVFNHTSADYWMTNTGGIAGTDVTMSGGLLVHHVYGTTTLRGGNTFSGGTRISGGRLFAMTGSSFGTGAIILDDADATLGYRADLALANAVSLRANGNLEVLSGVTATQSGSMTESGGSFGFSKTGTGILVLSGSNTYTGTTTLAEGSIEVRNDFALGTGTLRVSNPETKLLYRQTTTLANAIAVSGTLTINRVYSETDEGLLNLSGPITEIGEASSVVIENTYEQGVELSGINTYSGRTELKAGRLVISQDANLGAASAPLWLRSGTLTVTGNSSASRPIEVGHSDDYSWITLEVAAGKNYATSVPLQVLGGGAQITKAGAGVFTANGMSSSAPNATLAVVEGTFATTGAIVPRISISGSATLQIGDGGALAAMPALAFDAVESGARIAFNHSNDHLLVGAGLPFEAVIVQAGPGTTELDGPQSFAGLSVINGTLVGADLSGYTLEIASGATLALRERGYFTAATIAGKLSLKNEAGDGELYFKNLTLESTAILELGIQGTADYESAEVSDGTLVLGGSLWIELGGGFTPQIGDSFQIFDYDDLTSLSGTFAQIQFSNSSIGGAFDPETGVLTIVSVPEPASLALLVTTLLAFALFVRRPSLAALRRS